MNDSCEHLDNEAWRHLECYGCRLTLSRAVSVAGRALSELAPQMRRTTSGLPVFDPELTGHRADMLIIDDPHQAHPLLESDVDLSNILATRAVLADFDEQFCDGIGDPAVRAALVAQFVDEILPLARTEEQREAVRMTPRPGVLYRQQEYRTSLTQLQTDGAIRSEAWAMVSSQLTRDTVRNAAAALSVGARAYESMQELAQPGASVIHQRGGIDSDPLVRLLAFRTWGTRDMRCGNVEIDINGDVVPSLQWAASNATPIDDVIAGIMRAREHVGLPPRVTVVTSERVDELSREAQRRVSVGYTAPSESMRASTRQDKPLPPVPKWAKTKRSRAGRPGR